MKTGAFGHILVRLESLESAAHRVFRTQKIPEDLRNRPGPSPKRASDPAKRLPTVAMSNARANAWNVRTTCQQQVCCLLGTSHAYLKMCSQGRLHAAKDPAADLAIHPATLARWVAYGEGPCSRCRCARKVCCILRRTVQPTWRTAPRHLCN